MISSTNGRYARGMEVVGKKGGGAGQVGGGGEVFSKSLFYFQLCLFLFVFCELCVCVMVVLKLLFIFFFIRNWTK